MNQAIENVDLLEGGYEVDEETGEILSGPPMTLDNLPWVARQIRGLERRADMVEAYRKAEMQRIKEVCDAKIENLLGQASFFLAQAKTLVDGAEADRVEYPGLGVFRYAKQREGVDDTEFSALEKEAQEHLREEIPHLFREKVTYAPDKKAILAELKSGKAIVGFSIRGGGKEFVFKPE